MNTPKKKEPIICAKCVHYMPPSNPVHHYRDGTCMHEAAHIKVDIISGKKEQQTCVYMREGKGICGIEGLLYEKKDTHIPFD